MANKLGVITDGISRDFERALQVLTEAGLNYAELQYLWEKEVGDLNDDEMAKAERLPLVDGFINDCFTEDKNFPAVMAQHLRAWGSGSSVQDIFGKKEAKKEAQEESASARDGPRFRRRRRR